MKVSLHNGKKGVGSARHNSRNYDYEKLSKHIDPEKVKDNLYLCVYPELKNNFPEAEKKFFEEYFSKTLDDRNERCIRNNNKSRVKTMKQFMNLRQNIPQETIIQIGDMHEHGSKKDLVKLYNELQRYSNEISRGHCKTLNVAIHFDESTPHAHMRQLWIYDDENERGEKVFKIGREEALRRAGIERPFPDQPESRYNNRFMTYTRLMRERAEEFCIARGLDIDKNRYEKRPHLEKVDYINHVINKEKEKVKEREMFKMKSDDNEDFIV